MSDGTISKISVISIRSQTFFQMQIELVTRMGAEDCVDTFSTSETIKVVQ
ncbi:unnamed protein product [Haemonchus placei]|uniref:Uncharacterized protein n=1 Tax=Haemonchus placei TaxID=6290 RepID=A0A0N4WX39_HAEPC|nr:unnamed protein product [Haemonchus placei]